MAIEISIELSDQDIEHFAAMARAVQQAFQGARIDEKSIINATNQLLEKASAQENLPKYIAARLTTLQILVNMIQDKDWELPDEDRKRILSAIAYFEHPEDLIPDRIPGIGFLDDAIMIDLIEREMEPEISTYREFCQYRIAEQQRRKNLDMNREVKIEDWLADKRATLHSRMRKRRQQSMAAGRTRIYLW